MTGTLHISDIADSILQNAQKGQLNFVQAATGQGKTVAAIHTFPSKLRIAPQKCLILIDTIMGRDNKIQVEGCKRWGQAGNLPTVMTYAEFSKLVKAGQLYSNTFEYIACDEIHNLAKYARIEKQQIRQNNPTYDDTTISLILTRESVNYKAFETLRRWCELGNIWMFGFSATPRMLEEWYEATAWLNKIQHDEQLVVYEILEKYTYNDIHQILAENPNHKRLLHAATVEQVQEFAEEINTNTGRTAIPLWSRSNSQYLMDSQQIQVAEYLANTEAFPPEVDDIVATEAFATGYNLNDDSVQEIIIHTGNPDIQTQFIGRKRADVPLVGIYDAKGAKTKKKNTKRKNKITNICQTSEWIIPNEYLNKKLNTQDKEKLIQLLHFPKKWSSLKKVLITNYTIKTDTHGYSIIIPLDNDRN